MKRLFDIIASLIGLVLLAPLFLIISLIIWFSNSGPVFFHHQRIGKNGKMFMLYKFRSMRVPEFPEHENFNPGDTSRVTQLGKFLRRLKLDELPQLLNVLKGDMSLVGPRPEIARWIAAYPERWAKVLKVKPGITDNASILFRREEYLLATSEDPEKTYREVILPKKLDLYEEYVVKRSFFGDIKLIFKTLFSILLKK